MGHRREAASDRTALSNWCFVVSPLFFVAGAIILLTDVGLALFVMAGLSGAAGAIVRPTRWRILIGSVEFVMGAVPATVLLRWLLFES